MRKTLAVLIVAIIALGLYACRSSEEDGIVHGENSSGNGSDYGTTAVATQYEEIIDNSVHYISDRRVQYDEATEEHIVFFGLQNSNKEYVSAAGTAKISIVDDSSTTIYSKNIKFSEADFTEWTNRTWDSARYMCGLYIPDSDLGGSASSSGNLTLEVELDDGTYFSADTLVITNLPPLTVSVELPNLPSQYTDSRYYSYSSTVEVTKLEYESTMSYDGTARLSFTVIIKLVSKTGNVNESNSVCVGYKLYDSDGIVVDSGSIYSDPIAIGEASKDSFSIYDLDPRDKYVLKLENAS